MRYRLMATYRGAPYQAGVGPSDTDVVLFAACPPPEELGFEPATGHWRKRVTRAEVEALWEARPVGTYRGARCVVLDDLGERLHIAYLGHDAYQAEKLGYWQVDRGVFEVVAPREEVSSLTEERVEHGLPGRELVPGLPYDPALGATAGPPPHLPDQPYGPTLPPYRAAPPTQDTLTPATPPEAAADADADGARGVPSGTPYTTAVWNGVTASGDIAAWSNSRAQAEAPPWSDAAPGTPLPPEPPASAPQPPIAPGMPGPAQEAAERTRAQPAGSPAAWGGNPPGGDVRARETAAQDSPGWARAPDGPPPPARRSARRTRVETRWIFSELVDLAAIPQTAYAVDEEVDGAMCLIRTDDGFEVFHAADGARHEARFFDDEEAAYFYLFGVLAAEAVRSGGLAPHR